MIDLNRGIISVPREKIENIKSSIKSMMGARSVRARDLVSVVGKLIAMGPGVGPVCRLMTRSMYAILNKCCYWGERVVLNQPVLYELRFWVNHLEEFNSQSIWVSPSAVRMAYSDASSTGYGGYILEHGSYVACGQWTQVEAVKSSTWRELRAVELTLQSLLSYLSGHRVKWFTDNQNIAHLLLVGSRKPATQGFLEFSVCAFITE